MNLLADESVDFAIVERLRRDGHQVDAIMELSPSVSDAEVLRRAYASQSVLVTADKDFGEMVYRQGKLHAGVILIRLAGLDEQSKTEIVAETLRDHGAEMVHAFTVIAPGGVRIRTRS